MKVTPEISEWIKGSRLKHRFNVNKFADEIGYTRNSVSAWEHGHGTISEKALFLIGSAMGTHIPISILDEVKPAYRDKLSKAGFDAEHQELNVRRAKFETYAKSIIDAIPSIQSVYVTTDGNVVADDNIVQLIVMPKFLAKQAGWHQLRTIIRR